MNKAKETLLTAWKAALYSFTFCLRNNPRDTKWETLLRLTRTGLGYTTVLVMGWLISSLQKNIVGITQKTFTLQDFISGGYFLPTLLMIAILFVEIVVQKFLSWISNRRRHVLKFANALEMNALKASLDIARIRSRQFDDLEKRIDELPNGSYTRVAFAGEVMELLGDILTFGFFGISLAISHPIYVLIIIVTSLPMIIAEFIAVNRSWKLTMELIPHRKRRSVLERVYHSPTSFLQGIMFDQMPVLSKQIKLNQDFIIESQDKLRWWNVQITLVAYLVAIAGLSVVLIYSVWSMFKFGGDLGALTIVIASARRLQGTTREIVIQIANQWLSAKGVVLMEEEFLLLKPFLKTENPIEPEFRGAPTIRFENVCFAYPEKNSLVLKNISFEIEPGTKVVIVGKNGSGKSSLMGLLLRHYDPTSGRIYAGDIPLQRIKSNTWSSHICALLQNFVIHERSIEDEIASSRMEEPVDPEKVQEAIRFAEFSSVLDHDLLGLKCQIGTEFGGREFSGGEEQRLALARAKYRNTPILILDEPDSKLDPEAAQRLIHNIFALKGVTVIMVTQHVSRATGGDKVIVLEDGEIAEEGKHEELVKRNGKYASMFQKDSVRLGG